MIHQHPIALLTGHGPQHPGARSGGFTEWELIDRIFNPLIAANTPIAIQYISTEELEKRGITDNPASSADLLRAKVGFINSNFIPTARGVYSMEPIAVEVHLNSYPADPRVQGFRICHYEHTTPAHRRRCGRMGDLFNAYRNPYTRANVNTLGGDRDYFVEATRCPAIVLELEFMSNREALDRLLRRPSGLTLDLARMLGALAGGDLDD